jgi:hypothetical protein
MRTALRSSLIGGALLLTGAAFAAIEYLNFTDFCYSERRYLGDAGLVDRTIQFEIEHAARWARAQGLIEYASVEQFREANPRCCTLVKWGDVAIRTPRRRFAIWARRVLGEYFIVVGLDYRLAEDGPRQFGGARYLIDSCGRASNVVAWWGAIGNH